MGAIAEALSVAGYQPAPDRLRAVAIAVLTMHPDQWAEYANLPVNAESDRIQRRLIQVGKEAVRASPRNWDGAKDALYAKIRKDTDLLWELFAPYRVQAVQRLLTEAAALVREEDRPKLVTAEGGAGGRKSLDNHRSIDPRAEDRTGQASGADHGCPARPNSAQAGASALANVTRLSLLDTFKVNGQPIGDLTAAEAVKWAGARERDARFVRALTANLPPDQPIRKFRTGEDAATIYAEAENAE